MPIPPVTNTSSKPTFFENIKKKLGGCTEKMKTCCKNEKVTQVMLGVLSVMIGMGVGALIGVAFTATAIVIGAAVGALVGGFTYAAVMGVQHVIKTKAYPAHEHTKMTKSEKEDKANGQINRKPLSAWGPSKDWESDDNLEVFKDVIKSDFKDKAWFKAWKTHKDFKSDNQAAEYLFGKWIRKVPLSLGEAQELLRISKQSPELKGEDFLRKVRAESLYQRQIPEFVRQDLLAHGKGKVPFKEVSKEVKIIPGLTLDPTPLKIDLKNLGSFEADLKNRLDTDIIGATLQLDGKNKPTLFIRLQKPYSFYDPFSKKFGGLHENFPSKEKFVEMLRKNLESYKSPWHFSKTQKRGIIKFYR